MIETRTDPRPSPESGIAHSSIYETIDRFDSSPQVSATNDLATLHHLLTLLRTSSSTSPSYPRALDQLFARAMSIVLALRPATIAAALPAPRKIRQLVRDQNEVLQILIDELLALHEKIKSHIAPGYPRPTDLILWRILYALSERLLMSYLTATRPPPGLWQQLHKTYATVIRLGIADRVPAGQVSELRAIYLKALLLGCANPESLTPLEIDFVWRYLDRFAEHTNPDDDKAPAKVNLFWIDTESDTAPTACSRKTPPPDTPVRYFSWSQLENLLEAQLTILDNGKPIEAELPPILREPTCRGILRHLLSAWGAPAKRRYPRRRQNYRAEICTGLDSLWHLLKDNKGDNATTTRWMIINESPDGYAAMHVSGKTGIVSVGDIAAIRTETGNEWQICIVRRALSENQEHLELGLQILATHATSAELAIPENHHAKQIPVLVLPSIEILGISEMIVAASGSIENKKGELVLVIEKKNLEIREIRTTDVGEQNSLIELFSIERASLDT